MKTRRQLLLQGVGTVLGLGATNCVWGDQDKKEPRENPDPKMITPETRKAIDAGLKYLAGSQHKDGSFGTLAFQGNLAITSLAGLAMVAGGHLPNGGAYKEVVGRALDFVLDHEEKATPGYFHNPKGSLHGPMYSHGYATLFLAKLHGMVPMKEQEKRQKGALERAVKLILSSQNQEGGWRYHPASRDADISVTSCQVAALTAAKEAGIAVPRKSLDRCVEYIKKCQDVKSGGFYYMVRGGSPGFARSAAAMASLDTLGVKRGKEIESGMDYLMQFLPGKAPPEKGFHYFTGHYYAAQVMWQAGGERWAQWYPGIRQELLGKQSPDGSWPDQICRHHGTAVACIILQTPHGYLFPVSR